MAEQNAKVVNLLKGDSIDKRLERKVINLSRKKEKPRSNKSTFDGSALLRELSETINRSISDNESLFEILPDIKLAMSFLISAILSPKDLLNCKLNYSLSNLNADKEIVLGVTNIIEEFFTQKYKLDSILPDILEEALFKTGSYPFLILPETEVDKIINSDCVISKENQRTTNDNFNKSLGILSKNKKIYKHLEVSDNFNLLKKPIIDTKIKEDALDEIFNRQSISLEKNKINYYKRKYQNLPLSIVEIDDKKATGEPIVIKLSSECIIPVHIPGNPSDHIGYFILLDKNGYPINGERDRKTYEQLQGRLSIDSNSDLKELIKQTKMAIFGYSESNYKPNEFNIEIYTKMLEAELIKKMEEGVYKDSAEISNLEEISKIMLARALSEKHSTLLFVPEKIVTYVAFEYNKYGVGQSLLETTKILSSLRSVLLFANVLASIKNSVPRTGVKIDLDEADPNPRETVEFLLNEFAKNHNQAFPIGLTNPADIVDAIQRSSIDVAVSGNTAYPETTLDITDKTRAVAKPDQELENQLRRRHYMALGLPPEIIDADMNVDFATTIIASNTMVAKRISLYQNQLCEKLSDFIRKYILSSENLTNEIISKIGKKKKEESQKEIFTDIINAITVTLPSPDVNKLENQINAFDTYTGGLEKSLMAYFSPELVGRLIPTELEDAIEPTLNCIKAYYQRLWLQNNNVFSELTSLIDINDPESKLRMDIIQDEHIKSLLETVGKLMAKIQKTGEAMMVKLGDTPEDTSGGEPSGMTEPEETTEEENTMGDEEEVTPDTELELPEGETAEETPEGEEPTEEETL